LDNNIKCGNSLIGPDFYDKQQMNFLDEEERYRINVFDWHAEFPEVFQRRAPDQYRDSHGAVNQSRARKEAVTPVANDRKPLPHGRGTDQPGGFDAVIGNPPWGATFSDSALAYLRRVHRRVVDRMIDSYVYFLDRALLTCAPHGFVGFVIPSTVLNQIDTTSVRRLLIDRGLSVLVNLGKGVFGTRVLNTSTILVSNTLADEGTLRVGDLTAIPPGHRHSALGAIARVPFEKWRATVVTDRHHTFHVGDSRAAQLLGRLRLEYASLDQWIDGTIQRGVSPDIAQAHVVSKADLVAWSLEQEVLRPSISGPRIKRYAPAIPDQWIIWTTRDTAMQRFPNTMSFLQQFRKRNTCREVAEGKHPWWALHRPRDPHIFSSPKLIGLTTTRHIELVADMDGGLFVTDAMYVFHPRQGLDITWFAGVLQSRLFQFLYGIANQGESRVIPQIKAAKLQALPFAQPRRDPDAKRAAELVGRMHLLQEELSRAKTPTDKTVIQRQIDATDRQIDQLVYELYGLTDDEIRIVEEATNER
jgi:hypothetical protein